MKRRSHLVALFGSGTAVTFPASAVSKDTPTRAMNADSQTLHISTYFPRDNNFGDASVPYATSGFSLSVSPLSTYATSIQSTPPDAEASSRKLTPQGIGRSLQLRIPCPVFSVTNGLKPSLRDSTAPSERHLMRL